MQHQDMIDDKIKTGYTYRIGSDEMLMVTGSGGALEYIKTCREKGIPEEMIGDDIFINTDEGTYPIKALTWFKRHQS